VYKNKVILLTELTKLVHGTADGRSAKKKDKVVPEKKLNSMV
jgi:hypothetical protein